MANNWAPAREVLAMRRTLPRPSALLVLVAFLACPAAVSAQEQVALGVANAATVLPASLTSGVLFPATGSLTAAVETAQLPPAITQSPRYDSPRRPAVLPALYASNIVLQAMDVHSTMKAMSAGAQEANPLMKGAASNSGTLIAVKAGVTGASIYLCEKLWKRNPMAAVAVMAVMNGVNAMVVAHNYKVARGLR
jgi:hypothetical protein